MGQLIKARIHFHVHMLLLDGVITS